MSTLFLTNSLSRQREAFVPLDPAHVRLYACGPTVYSTAHIGNARMAVVFDMLVRVLRQIFPKVTYVSNITDIDDKIMQAAAETGEPIDALTSRYTDIYNQDMAALGVAAPDLQPRATAHVGDMIRLIETLIAGGHAYAAQGHVLFHVPSFPAYGALSGRSRDEQIAGARVDVAPYKQDPADFVLWKPSLPGQPGWDSPWGFGRPGWHIECSAMAGVLLGLPFDIHGGGADLKFPHHENEIAQSCSACGALNDAAAFSRIWVHNGFVTVEGEKMSKSLGNFTCAHDLLKDGVSGDVIRMALLSAHYRAPLDWSRARLQAAQKTLDACYEAIGNEPPATDGVAIDDVVMDALCDDLNTHKALDRLIHMARGVRSDSDRAALSRALAFMGFTPWRAAVTDNIPPDVQRLVELRAVARAARDFAESDRLRDAIAAAGYIVEDSKQGQSVKRITP